MVAAFVASLPTPGNEYLRCDGEVRHLPRNRQQITMKFTCNCLIICTHYLAYGSELQINFEDFRSTFVCGVVAFRVVYCVVVFATRRDRGRVGRVTVESQPNTEM